MAWRRSSRTRESDQPQCGNPRESISTATGISDKASEKLPNLNLRLIRELDIDDYFKEVVRSDREFLRDQYDNIYTYFFAARRYRARLALRAECKSESEIVNLALTNLRTIDCVALFGELDRLGKFLSHEFGVDVQLNSEKANVNVEAGSQARFEIVSSLAKSPRTLEIIREMADLDYQLLSLFRTGEVAG